MLYTGSTKTPDASYATALPQALAHADVPLTRSRFSSLAWVFFLTRVSAAAGTFADAIPEAHGSGPGVMPILPGDAAVAILLLVTALARRPAHPGRVRRRVNLLQLPDGH